jgi:hypothetical protein
MKLSSLTFVLEIAALMLSAGCSTMNSREVDVSAPLGGVVIKNHTRNSLQVGTKTDSQENYQFAGITAPRQTTAVSNVTAKADEKLLLHVTAQADTKNANICMPSDLSLFYRGQHTFKTVVGTNIPSPTIVVRGWHYGLR